MTREYFRNATEDWGAGKLSIGITIPTMNADSADSNDLARILQNLDSQKSKD
jgi:hypothetical protein